MKTKNMDVRMTDKTIQQQKEIKLFDGFSISRTRERILAEGVDKLYKKMFKPSDILTKLNSKENE